MSETCPVCGHETLITNSKPILHWACTYCGNVFVVGEDKTISCLSDVQYKEEGKVCIIR
jgi:ribosomal protein L37AE/L43A